MCSRPSTSATVAKALLVLLPPGAPGGRVGHSAGAPRMKDLRTERQALSPIGMARKPVAADSEALCGSRAGSRKHPSHGTMRRWSTTYLSTRACGRILEEGQAQSKGGAASPPCRDLPRLQWNTRPSRTGSNSLERCACAKRTPPENKASTERATNTRISLALLSATSLAYAAHGDGHPPEQGLRRAARGRAAFWFGLRPGQCL